MTEFEETSKKIQDLVDEVFKQGVGVGYNHGLEVGTQNGYKRGYENGKKSEQTNDLISRQSLLDAIDNERKSLLDMGMKGAEHIVVHHARRIIEELPPVNPQEPKWDRLYSWLNDMRLGIAPNETVTDIDERNVRTAQVDLLDEIMEWMVKPQERSEKE